MNISQPIFTALFGIISFDNFTKILPYFDVVFLDINAHIKEVVMVNIIELKKTLIRLIIGQLRAELDVCVKAQNTALADSREAEGAMQSRYSTFKEEAQYLTIAQAEQARRLRTEIDLLERLLVQNLQSNTKVTIGSIVRVTTDDGSSSRTYFLLPSGGGKTLDSELGQLLTVNRGAPLGSVLFQKNGDDDLELPGQTGTCVISEIW